MGGASPYRARFIGLPPCGSQSRGNDGVPLGDNGEKFFGLVNVSNTCYANSVLQALYFCSPFRKSVIRHLSEEREEDGGDQSLLTSLAELFAQIDGQKRHVGCITPRRFLTRLRKANDLFCNSEHQDAHEFMQFLLNDIAENLKARVQKQRERDKSLQNQLQTAQSWSPNDDEQTEEEPRTWIHDIFQGYLVNQMKCLCCENVTVRRETFLDLSVDIERHTSIAACLRAFESTELLRSGNKFFCDMCGCLQEAEKRLRIYQLPSVLMLHLKRFKYVERLGRSCRLPYRVVFPLQLRIVEHRPPRRHGRDNGSAATCGTHFEPVSPSPDGDESTPAPQPPSRLFELRSVVVHIGRDSSRGHYVTVVRSGDHCVLLDDDVVRVVEPEVLRSFYGTAGTSSQVPGNAHASGGQQHHGGWGANDDSSVTEGSRGGYGHSPLMPLYERSPEGTCCGYLLFYEAVDGALDHDTGSELDLSAAADWISEDRNLSDSDSGESTEERAAVQPNLNLSDDSELTQAFEQRCIPRGPTTRQQYADGGTQAAVTSVSAATPDSAARDRMSPLGHDRLERSAPNTGTGHAGAFAWTASDEEGSRQPTSSSNYGSHGVRTLGSVVPAAGGAPEAVSPSRVNVVTMPSPTGSLSNQEGTDRG